MRNQWRGRLHVDFYSIPPGTVTGHTQAKYMTFMVSWWTVTARAMAAGPRSPSVPPEMLDWEPSERWRSWDMRSCDTGTHLLHCHTPSLPDGICFWMRRDEPENIKRVKYLPTGATCDYWRSRPGQGWRQIWCSVRRCGTAGRSAAATRQPQTCSRKLVLRS